MSSIVALSCDLGIVLSTDTIAYKLPIGEPKYSLIQTATHKLYQLSENVLAGAVGDFTSYLPYLNRAARRKLPAEKQVETLMQDCIGKLNDSRLVVAYRAAGKLRLDVCEFGHLRPDIKTFVSYPNPLLSDMFQRLYTSPEGEAMNKAGLLGTVGLVNGFNAMADTISAEMSSPFDTVCLLKDGIFVVTGTLTRLPISDIW